MKIINKIYIWFKNIILNILGVVMDMINKDNEYEVEVMKVKCEMARYIIEKSADGVKYIVEKSTDGVKYVFGSRKNRVILGILSISTGVGLVLSGCFNIPEDKEVTDNENHK